MKRLAAAVLLAALLPSAASAAGRPVVVELFTSEGCSSCPPAEALLGELARRPGLLPLAFHVTYWDRLGWRDPSSLPAATERQARYGERFGDGSYTPEMVVDGTKALVGSDRAAAAAAISAAAAGRTAAEVAVARDGERVSVRVGAGAGRGRVVLVGFDPERRAAIARGENAGRTLAEADVVRSVRDLGAWSGQALALDEPAPAGAEAAVLLEAPDGAIVGAARTGG